MTVNQYSIPDGKLSIVEMDGKTRMKVIESGKSISTEETIQLLIDAINENNKDYDKHKKYENFQKYWYPILLPILGAILSHMSDIGNFIIDLF